MRANTATRDRDDYRTTTARPTIGIADASVAEGDAGTATLTFTVTRTGDAEADQTFNYTLADGSTEAG